MKKKQTRVLLVILLMIAAPAWASNEEPSSATTQLHVEFCNKEGGGGGTSIPIKPLAHGGGALQSNRNNLSDYAVSYEFDVSKDSKFVTATFVIFQQKGNSPLNLSVKLPIQPLGSDPVKVPIAEGFSAYAILVPK